MYTPVRFIHIVLCSDSSFTLMGYSVYLCEYTEVILSILVLVGILTIPVFPNCLQQSVNILVHIFGDRVHVSIGHILR